MVPGTEAKLFWATAMRLWPFPSLQWDDKENQEFISPKPCSGTFSIPSPPLYSHDLIWIRAILKIKCWSFLFLENNVTLVNLKRLAHSTNCLYNSFCPLIIFHLVLLFKGIIRAVFTDVEKVGVGSEFRDVVSCSHLLGWHTKSQQAMESMLIRDDWVGKWTFPSLPPRQHYEKRVSGSLGQVKREPTYYKNCGNHSLFQIVLMVFCATKWESRILHAKFRLFHPLFNLLLKAGVLATWEQSAWLCSASQGWENIFQEPTDIPSSGQN